MTYLRSLFLNFLIVFFVAKIIPGVSVEFFENVPNIGMDILFSFIVGFFNSLIVPALVFLNFKITNFKIALLGFIISYLSFTIIAIFNLGIKATALGVVIGGTLVWTFSFLTNYLELKHLQKK